MVQAFLFSTLAIGLAEIGDRSLFLAILFGIRYQRPWPVFWGMALGLFLNQAVSAYLGVWLFNLISDQWHMWLVGIVFLVMAVWIMLPEGEYQDKKQTTGGIFFTAAVSFFVLEMADKTQLAVITLAGAFDSFLPVVLGATLGILLVTTPALWLGQRFAAWIPLKAVKFSAAGIFILLGSWMLLEAAGLLPELQVLQLERFLSPAGP